MILEYVYNLTAVWLHDCNFQFSLSLIQNYTLQNMFLASIEKLQYRYRFNNVRVINILCVHIIIHWRLYWCPSWQRILCCVYKNYLKIGHPMPCMLERKTCLFLHINYGPTASFERSIDQLDGMSNNCLHIIDRFHVAFSSFLHYR